MIAIFQPGHIASRTLNFANKVTSENRAVSEKVGVERLYCKYCQTEIQLVAKMNLPSVGF